jgi:hypothetical protein
MQDQAVTGPGSWVAIDPSKPRSVQLVISGTASVDIEASNDGVNAVPALQAGITASAGYVDSDPWLYLRANVKSISSGTVSVVVGAPS